MAAAVAAAHLVLLQIIEAMLLWMILYNILLSICPLFYLVGCDCDDGDYFYKCCD